MSQDAKDTIGFDAPIDFDVAIGFDVPIAWQFKIVRSPLYAH